MYLFHNRQRCSLRWQSEFNVRCNWPFSLAENRRLFCSPLDCMDSKYRTSLWISFFLKNVSIVAKRLTVRTRSVNCPGLGQWIVQRIAQLSSTTISASDVVREDCSTPKEFLSFDFGKADRRLPSSVKKEVESVKVHSLTVPKFWSLQYPWDQWS